MTGWRAAAQRIVGCAISLAERIFGVYACRALDQVSEGFDYPHPSPHVLRLPTIHVHGMADPGVHLHRRLMEQYCDRKSVTLVEWGGGHRVPLKKTDVDRIIKEIYRVAAEQGIKC